MEEMIAYFHQFWKDLVNLSPNLLRAEYMITCFLIAATTLVIIYIGWLYTKTNQLSSESRLKNENMSDSEKTKCEDHLETSSAENGEQRDETIAHKWPFDSSAAHKIPKGCPMSKMYKDISQMSNLVDAENDEKPTEIGTRENVPPPVDPKEFCDHIQGEYKRSQQKTIINKLEKDMTDEQKEKERLIKQQQLEAIFALIENQESKFGVQGLDEMQSQMKLYM